MSLTTFTSDKPSSRKERSSRDSDLHPPILFFSTFNRLGAHLGDGSRQAWSSGTCSHCQWRRLTGPLLTSLFSQDHLFTPISHHSSPLTFPGSCSILLLPRSQPRAPSLVSLGAVAEVGWSEPHALLSVEHKLSVLFLQGCPL